MIKMPKGILLLVSTSLTQESIDRLICVIW